MQNIGLQPNQDRVKQRNYTRDNRELWKSLGYRMMSALVHDDDRKEVLAELEVRRMLRMVNMAEDKKANVAEIVHIGSRNITPPPLAKAMTEKLKSDDLQNMLNRDEIEFCIEKAIEARKTFNGLLNNEKYVDDDNKYRHYAKQVAYGNLASAWWKLAMCRMEQGDRKSVFNQR